MAFCSGFSHTKIVIFHSYVKLPEGIHQMVSLSFACPLRKSWHDWQQHAQWSCGLVRLLQGCRQQRWQSLSWPSKCNVLIFVNRPRCIIQSGDFCPVSQGSAENPADGAGVAALGAGCGNPAEWSAPCEVSSGDDSFQGSSSKLVVKLPRQLQICCSASMSCGSSPASMPFPISSCAHAVPDW